MSLSWRKRQAQASDQKSWRALGTDSALWKGIDKNAGNVKTALGGAAATTEGIVTGLKILFDDINKRYDEAVTQYKLNGVVGQAILGPYSPGSDAVARTHLSQRSGWFE